MVKSLPFHIEYLKPEKGYLFQVEPLHCSKISFLHGLIKSVMISFSVDKLWEAASCAASYLLFDPDDDTMIDNLRFFHHQLGNDGIKITARRVKLHLKLFSINICYFYVVHMVYMYMSV